ncbi:MAG: hypothetical protein ABS81_22135 [Pseudonocardia sp. SCN 72-86]|nr:MAG: hypothetical protein ABS81_22135 [Pseudonocardia sp. SCN 72-86]
MVLWVHTGSATVELAHGDVRRLGRDHGIWIPAGCTHRVVTVDAGSLAFPLLVPPDATDAAPTHAVVFAIPDGWRDWLVQQHLHRVAPVIGFGHRAAALLSLLGPGTRESPRAAPPANTPPRLAVPVPRSPAAGRVARELLRDPSIGLTVEQWATRVSSSPRSLRRDFADGTGTTFAEWRTRVRVGAATDLLAAGHPVAAVAVRCGFAGRGGLARAFRAVHGTSPAAFRRTAADAAPPGPGGPTERGAGPTEPRQVTTTWTAPRVNDFHVLIWVYRGSAHARVADTRYDLARGDAIWLPAGVVNQTGSPEDAIGIPVGDVPGHAVMFDGPLRARFPRSWDVFLLHCSVAAYTGLKPEYHDQRRILDVFTDRFAAQQARALPMPTDPAALDAARDVLRAIASSSPGNAARRGGSTLDAVFRRETGLSFRGWQHAARMRAAADMIERGLSPSAVAHRVGYAHLSNFSRAFRRFHGAPAREVRVSRAGA